jgi:hypothetical protein
MKKSFELENLWRDCMCIIEVMHRGTVQKETSLSPSADVLFADEMANEELNIV